MMESVFGTIGIVRGLFLSFAAEVLIPGRHKHPCSDLRENCQKVAPGRGSYEFIKFISEKHLYDYGRALLRDILVLTILLEKKTLFLSLEFIAPLYQNNLGIRMNANHGINNPSYHKICKPVV
jgi:hypothetical protein